MAQIVRPLRIALVLALIGMGVARAVAEDSASIEARLRKLEATVQSLQQENTELRRELGTEAAAPAARPMGDALQLVGAGHETKLIIGGYLHAQAEFGDAGDERFAGTSDRFYLRRARVFVAGVFAEHFDFKLEEEFGANSVTAATGLRATANEVYIGWTRFPIALVHVGQLKPAFGGEQLQPESKSPTVERYLGSDRLTDSRQLGMSIAGDLIEHRLSYMVVVGNGNGPSSSANDNNKFMHTARLAGVVFDRTDIGRLSMGVNGLYSDDAAVSRPGFGFDSAAGGAVDNIFAGRRVGSGADAMWHFGLLDVSAELLRVQFRPRNHLPTTSFVGQGWELMTTYFVVPQTLQVVVRRESFDPNESLSGDNTENWVVGLNYFIKGDDLRFVVDYLFGHAAALPNDHGRLMTRFQLMF